MAKVKINDLNEPFEVECGMNLMDVLIKNNIFVDNPCNGKGTCGKCKVKILGFSGKPVSKTEKKMLSIHEIKENIRLSCMVNVEEDMTVRTLQVENTHKILNHGHVPSFEFDSTFQGGGHRKYGIAVDIGTTTVVASLVNIEDGTEMSTASMINPQKKYGLDVLTRITYSIENPDCGIKTLQDSIVGCLNGLIEELIVTTNIAKDAIIDMVVSANTTMLHFLLGVDSKSIGRSPYKPVFLDSQSVRANSIGISLKEDVMVYCLPSVSSFIGADIVSGCYVGDLKNSKASVLFIDIGTNGEIVLSHQGQLSACSCAAGPALEGMNISSGVRAQDGAIEEMLIAPEGIKLTTIGNQSPIGMCGSGILAALREMLKSGIVNKRGGMIKLESLSENDYRLKHIKMVGKKRELKLGDRADCLTITQSDIRQVQLAKGAILSGLIALTEKAGVDLSALDTVYVAGQFGAHLSVDSLVGTGILPHEVKDKIKYLGNTSKTGAYMALMSHKIRVEMASLATQIDYFELADIENYDKLFAQSLLFE